MNRSCIPSICRGLFFPSFAHFFSFSVGPLALFLLIFTSFSFLTRGRVVLHKQTWAIRSGHAGPGLARNNDINGNTYMSMNGVPILNKSRASIEATKAILEQKGGAVVLYLVYYI